MSAESYAVLVAELRAVRDLVHASKHKLAKDHHDDSARDLKQAMWHIEEAIEHLRKPKA